MKLIVAADSNWNIGKDNKLLFKIPEDMKRFKKMTTNSGIVVMGRKTFESIGKPLIGRTNIIITSNKQFIFIKTSRSGTISFTCNIDEFKDYIKRNELEQSVCVIGGSSIYHQLFPYCSCAYVTRVVNKVYDDDADSKINFAHLPNWKLLSESDIRKYQDLEYKFEEYINFKPMKL